MIDIYIYITIIRTAKIEDEICFQINVVPGTHHTPVYFGL